MSMDGHDAARLRGNTVSILVVDDDDAVREMLVETLACFGYGVSQAASGEEALPLLSADPSIAMVITDVQMPGMSGLELADAVQRQRADVRVIVMSGFFQAQDVSQRFLRKPFHMRELALAVQDEFAL